MKIISLKKEKETNGHKPAIYVVPADRAAAETAGIQKTPASLKLTRLAVTAFFFMQGLCFASWASRIPDIKTLLHLSDAELGSVLFALPAGLMASLPLSGWMVTRFGSKKMLIMGVILYTTTLVLIGQVFIAWQLVVALFTFGLWGNLVNIAVNTQALGVEARYGKSIMASFHGAWSLAGFTGAAIALLLVAKGISPSIHFCIIAATVFILAFISYKNILPGRVSGKAEPLFAKPDGMLLRLGFIGFFGMACEGAMFDWSGVYFQKIVESPAHLTTLGYVAFMGTMTGGRFIGDYLANRLGRKRMLQLSGALIASGLGVAIAFPSIVMATAGFLLVGLGASSVVPLVYGAAGKSSAMSAGVALAAVSTISFMGFLLGPPVIGWIAEATNLRYSFALIAMLGFGITLLTSKSKLLRSV